MIIKYELNNYLNYCIILKYNFTFTKSLKFQVVHNNAKPQKRVFYGSNNLSLNFFYQKCLLVINWEACLLKIIFLLHWLTASLIFERKQLTLQRKCCFSSLILKTLLSSLNKELFFLRTSAKTLNKHEMHILIRTDNMLLF